MKIKPPQFAVPAALILHVMVSASWAQEPSKQPPLEMPKTMAQLDAPKSGAPLVVAEEKEKPKVVPAKKSKPAAEEMPAETSKELAGLPEMGNYKVKAGDTLDRVIQKFYASSPLRTDILRNALIQNNPQAFVKGNAKTLIAGANLMLPEQADLVKKLMPNLVADAQNSLSPLTPTNAHATPASVAPANVAPVGGAAAHQAGHNPSPDVNKRNWVRYP
jgi:Tfp pilus assembly protein FimV